MHQSARYFSIDLVNGSVQNYHMGSFKDLTGEKHGKLLVLEKAGKTASGNTKWYCKCDCGAITVVVGANLRKTKSCGCLQREKAGATMTTHGGSTKRSYKIWRKMIERCSNPNAENWKYYGGRGIVVCDRWRSSYENFVSDMGEPTIGQSIDRIDNDLGYDPCNCRWADHKTQVRNSRRQKYITVCGEILRLKEACDKYGIKYQNLIAKVAYSGLSHTEVFLDYVDTRCYAGVT